MAARPSQGKGPCCSPIQPGSQRACLRAALASLRHGPTQHKGKAHACMTKPCHLCLTTEVANNPFGKAGLNSLCQPSLSFQETRCVTSCSQLSESEFHTCTRFLCCFEEVTTSNCFHMLKDNTEILEGSAQLLSPALYSFPLFASLWDHLHCKAAQEVQEANTVACTSRQHAVRKQ